jgi:hypothetical protein
MVRGSVRLKPDTTTAVRTSAVDSENRRGTRNTSVTQHDYSRGGVDAKKEGASGLGYQWIYQKVLDDQDQLSQLIRKHKLTLPGMRWLVTFSMAYSHPARSTTVDLR